VVRSRRFCTCYIFWLVCVAGATAAWRLAVAVQTLFYCLIYVQNMGRRFSFFFTLEGSCTLG